MDVEKEWSPLKQLSPRLLDMPSDTDLTSTELAVAATIEATTTELTVELNSLATAELTTEATSEVTTQQQSTDVTTTEGSTVRIPAPAAESSAVASQGVPTTFTVATIKVSTLVRSSAQSF